MLGLKLNHVSKRGPWCPMPYKQGLTELMAWMYFLLRSMIASHSQKKYVMSSRYRYIHRTGGKHIPLQIWTWWQCLYQKSKGVINVGWRRNWCGRTYRIWWLFLLQNWYTNRHTYSSKWRSQYHVSRVHIDTTWFTEQGLVHTILNNY